MWEILLKIRNFQKMIIKKALKKLTLFFFRTQSLLMDQVNTNKKGLVLGTSRTSDYELSSEKFIYSLCIIGPSLVKQFWSYSKNYICIFMQVSSWYHKLFHFHLSFWIWKLGKGREKITKNWISREQKELFRRNKKHCS